MEEVVLHYQPGSDARFTSQVETTEKLLTPFPCRAPPVFSPWYSEPRPTISPAKSAPVITSFESRYPQSGSHRPGIEKIVHGPQEHLSADISLRDLKENVLPPEVGNTRASHHKHKHSRSAKGSPSLRSWSVFTHRGVLLQTSQPLSEHFCHVVSRLKLHLRQRVKWVISKHNCAGDIEQAWCTVSRLVQTSQLPTCNANIQRERAEIWVFCDVARSEQAGHFLKDQLQLFGKICLMVHRHGNILSM